jgi:hypothetical protein
MSSAAQVTAVMKTLADPTRRAPKGLAPLIDWLGYYEKFWRERFENLEKLLEDDE